MDLARYVGVEAASWHTVMSPSPCKYCSDVQRAIGAGRRPLGWGTSGDAASSGFFFHLTGKGEFRGRTAQPQRALSALFAAPCLALPFVHLLSSDLTASMAVGRELLATRADGSNLLSLGFAQKANLAGFKASTSANGLTSAFPDILSEKCHRKGREGVLPYVEVPNFCVIFRNSSSTAPFLSPSPSGADQPAFCHLRCPPVPVLPSCNHSAGVSAPQQVHMQSSSRDGGTRALLPSYHTTKFVFLLRGIHRHITERGTGVSHSPWPPSKRSDAPFALPCSLRVKVFKTALRRYHTRCCNSNGLSGPHLLWTLKSK